MDFQKLFKRKEEGPAPPAARENIRDTLKERDVLVREGELLEGKSSPPLLWSTVGGAIRIRAEKILGIMEGRSRIKAEVLHEIYPSLFGEPPSPGTEFTVPLQSVVMQLQDVFAGMPPEETDDDSFDTPFGQLAREDEARFRDKQQDQPEVRSLNSPRLYMHSEPLSKSIVKEGDQTTGLEKLTARDYMPEEKSENISTLDKNGSEKLQQQEDHFTYHNSNPVPKKFGDACLHSSGVPGLENNNGRRKGLERLQELYLTDDLLDGGKVSGLIQQLPRVCGVVIMLLDGAVLGGGLSGALTEKLINLTPDFVTCLTSFTQNIRGGRTRFVTFSGEGYHVSLSISDDAMILVEHEGKNLPPGIRERLMATAQALNLIYGSQ